VRYVAFLRGINVGGHKPLKMDVLRKAFESLKFQSVTTVLASGNVLFQTRGASRTALAKKIERRLATVLKHDILVIVRTVAEIQSLVDANPFKHIRVTPHTRFYVTFLSEAPKSVSKTLRSLDKNLQLVRVSNGEVCSLVTLSADGQTTDLMAAIEKEFGRGVTTRNWNTIARILSN